MSKCQHNKYKTYCKLCKVLVIGGKCSCDHNRQKSRCKDCKNTCISIRKQE